MSQYVTKYKIGKLETQQCHSSSTGLDPNTGCEAEQFLGSLISTGKQSTGGINTVKGTYWER